MKLRKTSMIMGAAAMFAAAILSFAAGCEPVVCTTRGLAAAAVAYLLTNWAVNMIARILAAAIAGGPRQETKVENVAAENG